MKSFEQFEYEQSPITEIVGVDVSKRFEKGSTSSAANKVSPTKGSPPQTKKSIPSNRRPTAGNEKVTQKVKVVGKSAPRQEPQGSKAPSIPTRAGRLNDGTKKRGIQATLDRNKERAGKYADSKRGQRQLSAVGGAANAFRKYQPDKEDATTGTGLGTNMRALSGRAQATMAGGISAFKSKKKQQDTKGLPRSKVTGSDSDKVTTGSTGAGSLIGQGLKYVGNKIVGRKKPQEVKTSGGKTITGDAERYRPGQERRAAARKTAEDKYKKSREVRKQTNQDSSKSPEDSKGSSALRKFAKSPDNKTVEKQIKTASKDTSAKSQVEKDSGQKIGGIVRSPGGKLTTTGGDGGKTDSPIVKGAVKAAIKQSDKRKKSEAGADRLMAAMRAQGKKDDKSGDKAITVKATSVPKKAGRPKGSTSGKRGRSATKASRGEQVRNKADEIIKGLRDEKAKDIKEASNFIRAQKQLKDMGKKPMRTYAQMQKDKAKAISQKKLEQQSESYSHWREEFIWETDKKYPEKVKEIKPMTGKNTITINPEDETSKYKRGY